MTKTGDSGIEDALFVILFSFLRKKTKKKQLSSPYESRPEASLAQPQPEAPCTPDVHDGWAEE